MRFDVVVVGGGAAGCAVAARLSQDDRITVALLEAGPDYGHYDPASWPPEMLDATTEPTTHDWDPDGPSCCARGKVIGGSSAHNGCWAVLAAPPDLDWNPTWTSALLRPHLDDAWRTLRVRSLTVEERTAWHQAVVAQATTLGLPELADVNAPSPGAGWVPLNALGRLRWHAAFGYLDPARPRVTVLGNTVVDRITFSANRATGVHVQHNGQPDLISADRIVLCAGAYGNPPLLTRSGIGAPDRLRALGVPVRHEAPAVGRLADHAGTTVRATPGPHMSAQPTDLVVQSLVKARSSLATDEYWDLHLMPWADGDQAGISVFVLDPVSRGEVRTTSLDPTAPPEIDHGFFTDPDGRDLRKLRDGVDLARELMTDLAAVDTTPGEHIGYGHPTSTCAMGAVTDHLGRVPGLPNVHIADASVIPVVPRANTHITTVAVADRMATLLAQAWGISGT